MQCDLQRQLDEIEALRSMYPEDEGCFCLAPAEQQTLSAVRAALAATQGQSGGWQHLPVDGYLSNLSGTIKLPGVLLDGSPVSLHFQLPAGYPSTAAPQIMVACAAPRLLHEQLSAALVAAAQEAEGSESLLLLIDRLQEEVANANTTIRQQQQDCTAPAATGAALGPGQTCSTSSLQHQQHPGPANPATADAAGGVSSGPSTTTAAGSCAQQLLRVVIWFHHIKNTQKRKDLVGWARELNVRGFSKPGFPGVVIAEGCPEDVREYVARIRALQWQAMQVRGEEELAARPACSSGCASKCSSSSSTGGPTRGFVEKFAELPESGMSELGQYCKAAGVEQLFLAALKLPTSNK